MSSSLQDQLLSAGLISKDQVRKNQSKKRRKKGQMRVVDPETQERQAVAAANAQREKERAQELNQQREQARKAQQQADRIRQILTSRGLPKAGVNDDTTRFNFQLDKRVHGLHVTAEQRSKLVKGALGIVHFDGSYHLLPLEHAQRIQELSPQRVWIGGPDDDTPKSEDDPYAAYEVPDDLIW